MKRTECPQNLKEVLLVSKYITLYLVQSKSPAYFVFVDPLNNYFKVNIANNLKCSCLPGNTDHCLHTFYVLRKIFKLNESNPLIYQQSYNERQISYIYNLERIKNQAQIKQKYTQTQQLNHKFSVNMAQIDKRDIPLQQKSMRQTQQNLKILNFANNGEKKNILMQKTIVVEQYKIQKDSVCSICYELLENNDPIMKCSILCHNYFHIKCLKFWITYKKKQDMIPSCPMCRSPFQQNIDQLLKKQEQRFINYFFSFQTQCYQCKQGIFSKLYKCLICKDANICDKCYFGWKHMNHDRYLMKKSKRAEWSCPSIRTQGSMAKLDLSLKYIKQFKDQNEMKVLFGPNYGKFLQQNQKKQTILDYITNSLTSVSKEIYKTYKKLDYEQKDIKCVMCKKGKITQMRRMTCKHFIDQKCLTYLLINEFRCCPIDKILFLPAFQSLNLQITKK